MDVVQRNVRVVMEAADLAGAPVHPLPEGWALRDYRPGDARTWGRIQSAAERYQPITAELFRREFGGDEAALARRQLFLVSPQGRDVGTATAWWGQAGPTGPVGRVHWVAIEPAWQGRGLGRALLSATCRRLRDLGHERAYLVTSTGRLAAIGLYLHFGFAPAAAGPEDRTVWRELRPHLRPLSPRQAAAWAP
jgi:GNAT superfamily N-acetyltransferase